MYYFAISEVLKAMTLKSRVLWVVKPCTLERARHFRGRYHLHLLSDIVKPSKNPAEVGGKQS
jgi:hypothetical protein